MRPEPPLGRVAARVSCYRPTEDFAEKLNNILLQWRSEWGQRGQNAEKVFLGRGCTIACLNEDGKVQIETNLL